jgi:glycosyltransferase involved in cell wall biosynthesis
MKTSIIIAAHNEGENLVKTVGTCVETCGRLDHEIIVADDASRDQSIAQVKKRFPRVQVLTTPERRGVSPTKDAGAKAASGDVLVFLDGHCKPERGAIERLAASVERTAGGAIITPKVPALNTDKWKNNARQLGHGYYVRLADLACGWLPLGKLRRGGEIGKISTNPPA